MDILITGASGLLGSNLAIAAVDAGARVTAVSRHHALRASSAIRPVLADLARPATAARVVAEHRPDVVIHTAAATDVDACERDPDLAARANTRMAADVAAASAAVGAQFIHISTEAVFGPDRISHAELDPTGPVNAYGASKLAGELAVARADPGALIVRTTIYGWNALAKQSLGEFFVDRLTRGVETPGFADSWMTPILVDDLAGILLALATSGETGLLHVAGDGCISKAEFGRRLATAFGADPDLVRSVRLADASLLARRNPHACLTTDRASALGLASPAVDDGIARFRAGADAGRRDRLRDLLEVHVA